MSFRYVLTLAAAVALLASDVWAGEPEARPVVTTEHAFSARTQTWQAAEAAAPRIAVRADDVALPRLRLYAQSQGFSVGQRHSFANVVGGAGLRLAQRLCLTGSYRLLGYDLDSSVGQIDPNASGPFLGLTFDF